MAGNGEVSTPGKELQQYCFDRFGRGWKVGKTCWLKYHVGDWRHLSASKV